MWLRLSAPAVTPNPASEQTRSINKSPLVRSYSIVLSSSVQQNKRFENQLIKSNKSTIMAASSEPKPSIPYRQIRALYDDETITVEHQKLNASPDFKLGRMTWIKPSWCWMMFVLHSHSPALSHIHLPCSPFNLNLPSRRP
jgi:hypothetical protein